MTTLYPYKIKENYRRRKVMLPDQLYDLTDLPESLLRQKNPNPLKKLLKKLRLAKRISPFAVIAFCLPAVCVYFLFTQTQNGWTMFFSFMFLQINVLFIDFALWNYHKGKNIFYVWLIESCLAFPLLYWFAIVNNIPPFTY